MNFQKVPNENLHMLKVAITANTIIQTESSYTAQKTRTIYAFSVPILTKPLPRYRLLEKFGAGHRCVLLEEGSGVLTAFYIP